MIVVSVKFKGRGKTYFFDPNGLEVPEGVQVVVETSKGMELAECVQGNHEVTDARIVPPLRPVLRLATADDLRVAELCKAREKDALKIAERKIAEHGLDMKLVDVECNFEGSKMLFFFTSDGRVDFRELVKDLAGVFRTRIELRQIGVRDEAKMLGGIGICGRPYCCNQFLDDFEPVSTKMAKTQSLSLNPTKISGSCGRLMCCLRYEQEAYEDLVKNVPKTGAFVETPEGYGIVAQVNLLRQQVKVKLDGDESSQRSFDADEVATVPGGRPKPGEPLPHVLTAPPKKKEAPVKPEAKWVRPPVFAEDTAHGEEDSLSEDGEKKFGGSRKHRSRNSGGKKPSGQGGEKKSENAAPKGEQVKAPAVEKSAEVGEKGQGGSSSHRNHHRGRGGSGKKPEGQGEQPQNAQKPESGEKKSSAGQSKPKPEQKPKAPAGEPKPEGGEKKPGSGSHHRRNYYHKPKSKPAGGGDSPKS